LLVRPFPRISNRDDVKNGKTLHTLRVIEREAIGNTTAAIVPGNREARKSEFAHDRSHIVCHYSLRIRCMIRTRGGTTAAAVTAKIGADHCEAASKQRCDSPPHEMRLWESV
jgi:hypothetical protein